MNDFKNAIRQTVLRPGLSVVVIAMLALGIGATTAMFSLFHQVLLQPLPVPAPERLVNLGAPGPKAGPTRVGSAVIDVDATFSYPTFRELEARQSVFTGIAAHLDFQANLAYQDRTLAGRGTLVSGSYFSVLNLRPALGRLIGLQDEPRVGESAVAVLSHDYWQTQFGGDPNVIDQTLTVNGQSLTVVGVAPEGFSGAMLGWRPQIYVPITMRWLLQREAPPDQDDHLSYWLYLFARLQPDVTLEQASAAMNGLYGGILGEIQAPASVAADDDLQAQFLARRLTLEPGARGQSVLHGPARQPLTLLLGVTGLVLLIVCVNIANLLLARGASRGGEMAIRASVGASRGGLVSQLLVESGVLGVIGGALSLPVAAITLRVVTGFVPERFADGFAAGLSTAALLFAAGASLGTVLLFGLFPAWQASGADPARVIKSQTRQSSGGRGMARFRGILTTAQIGVSLLLLVLAGLFAQSLSNLARVDLGIDLDSLVSFSVAPGLNGYSGERAIDLYDRLEEGLTAQPGVSSVGSAMVAQIGITNWTFPVSIEGSEDADAGNPLAGANFVNSTYLDTLSVPLLAGRGFAVSDTQAAPRVAVVNESFVRRFGLGEDALGRRFGIGAGADPSIEIVGVVADAKYGQVKGSATAQFFQPWHQTGGSPWMVFYVRGPVGTEALMRMIPRVVSELDSNLPVSNLTTVEAQVEETLFLDRLITMLSAGFAGLATLLAAVGLYGVLAYNVAQRTRELGLRLALGAEPSNLRALVLRQVGLMAAVGGGVGLAAALGLGRLADALLFGLSGNDPVVLIAAVAVLSVVVIGASYLPARRASSIAPMEALRYE